MFTNQDSQSIHFLLLIKAIALFNADQHDEAMLLLKELAAACPNVDTHARRVVEAYLRVQLGTRALDSAHHDEATDHFTAAVDSNTFPSTIMFGLCEDLIVLFGWDLESFWLTTHQKRCQAFLLAGKVEEALESHQHMMDAIDETEKASCLDWSNGKVLIMPLDCALAAHDDRILGAEIPGQDQDGYDAEPDFFRGMHGHSQISRPRPQQRPGRLKKLRLAMTRNPRPVPPPPPVPAPAPPTALPLAATHTTFTAHVQHLFTWRPDHAAPPVVEVPFAQGRKRNAAAGAPADDDPDIIRAEYLDDGPQDPDTQQRSTQEQQQPVATQVDTGQHRSGKSCFCC
ncbi:hypothetical protein DEU56DRAFT_167764 [Suillus clintonianus]|uniref:uncharacterized protein n=1 Tax=Suillus clintonianus TaxID=1904413 RepID=UPI001B8847F8|nr:uncharacterized protein DEU56DRAFT_167764 [Suillus clintonianus]KAG2146241.1 hypothetical protein DEU56DRAFT_167764 [Suillus clintonianus]